MSRVPIVGGVEYGRGTGRSRGEAKGAAAQQAYAEVVKQLNGN